jgi:hypothetical protein
MFFESCDGNGELGCVEMKTRIKTLKDEFSSKLPSHRLNDISWVGDFALNDFNKVGVCVSCPAGTYNSNELDIDAKDYLGNLSVWTMRQLRCRPCGYGTYTKDVGQKSCTTCPNSQFVQVALVDVKIRTATDYEQTTQKRVSLLTSCAGCPLGTEYSPDVMATELEKRCSSTDFLMKEFKVQSGTLQLPESAKCCRPCPVNHYREKAKT